MNAQRKEDLSEKFPPRLHCFVAILNSRTFAMNSTAQSHPRTAKIAETPEEIAIVRQHLQEVLASAAFRGSHRSAQFLKHIVEQSIAGSFESLKERSIGIELFGRAPSYDTGEDAIVRVTASDVRKRLLQHYGTHGTNSEARFVLPLGSYVPELRRDFHGPENLDRPCKSFGASGDDCSAKALPALKSFRSPSRSRKPAGS